MIPNSILIGLVGGLIPRHGWWSIPAAGVVWSLLLSVGGDPSMSVAQVWMAGLALGTVNGAVGYVFTRSLVAGSGAVTAWLASRVTST